ncbi:MAG: flagellar basal body L-ring protein FlgH [Planctomycetaceae bacterium]
MQYFPAGSLPARQQAIREYQKRTNRNVAGPAKFTAPLANLQMEIRALDRRRTQLINQMTLSLQKPNVVTTSREREQFAKEIQKLDRKRAELISGAQKLVRAMRPFEKGDTPRFLQMAKPDARYRVDNMPDPEANLSMALVNTQNATACEQPARVGVTWFTDKDTSEGPKQLAHLIQRIEQQIEQTEREVKEKTARVQQISKKLNTPEEGSSEVEVRIEDEVQHSICLLDLRHSQRILRDLEQRLVAFQEKQIQLSVNARTAPQPSVELDSRNMPGVPILNGVPYISRLFNKPNDSEPNGITAASDVQTAEDEADAAAPSHCCIDASIASDVPRVTIVKKWEDILAHRGGKKRNTKPGSEQAIRKRSSSGETEEELLGRSNEHGVPILEKLPNLQTALAAKGQKLYINRSRRLGSAKIFERNGEEHVENVKSPSVLQISNVPFAGTESSAQVNAHGFTIRLTGDGQISAVAVGEKGDEQSQPAQAQGVIVFSTEDEKKDAPKPQVFHLELKGHPHLRVEANENGEGREHEEKLHLMMKQVHHLRQAAENLEQAGDKELAPKLREKAEHLEALARERQALAREKQAHQAEEMRLRAAKLREGHAARRGLHERENHETAELKELLTAIRRELHALREEVRELREELDDDDDEDREGDDDDGRDREPGERDRDETAQLRGTLRLVSPAEEARVENGQRSGIICETHDRGESPCDLAGQPIFKSAEGTAGLIISNITIGDATERPNVKVVKVKESESKWMYGKEIAYINRKLGHRVVYRAVPNPLPKENAVVHRRLEGNKEEENEREQAARKLIKQFNDLAGIAAHLDEAGERDLAQAVLMRAYELQESLHKPLEVASKLRKISLHKAEASARRGQERAEPRFPGDGNVYRVRRLQIHLNQPMEQDDAVDAKKPKMVAEQIQQRHSQARKFNVGDRVIVVFGDPVRVVSSDEKEQEAIKYFRLPKTSQRRSRIEGESITTRLPLLTSVVANVSTKENVRIDAEVTNVLANGNLMIRGTRIVDSKLGPMDYSLTGTVQAENVQSLHSIHVDDIAELRITKIQRQDPQAQDQAKRAVPDASFDFGFPR